MSDDEFGGFDEFDENPFGEEEVDTGAEENFGSAFGGGDDADELDGFGDEDFEEFAGDGAPAKAPAGASIPEDAEYDDEEGESSEAPSSSEAAAAKPVAAAPAPAPQSRPPPGGQPASSNITGSNAVAVRMNRTCTRVSQPFVAGYDMTTDSQIKVSGRALRRFVINGAMTAPGSFGAEIRSGPDGTGEVLAKDRGIRASSSFARTVIDFADDQPTLKDGEVYHLHIFLEQGAFKFQGAVVKSIKTVGKTKLVHSYSAKQGDSWLESNSALVIKPVFQKAVPKKGDKSGFLLVKKVSRSARGRRTSLRRTAKEGMRKFIVVEGKSIQFYSRPDGAVDKEIDLGTVEYIESKGGSMDTKDFNVVTKNDEFQFAAPSASECQKWLKVIEKAQKSATRDFGSAASTNMLF